MSFIKNLVERLPGSWQLAKGKGFAFGLTAAADLPTCNAARDGEHRWITGAAGVADREVVCEKDAANTYAWQDKGEAALAAAFLTEAEADALFLTPTEADAAYVNLGGDTMTGALTVNTDLSIGDDLAVTGDATITTLAGTGTRVVEASSAGLLSASKRILTASTTWDIPSTANLGVAGTTVTITGAAIGDPCIFSVTTLSGTNWVGWARVESTDTVRVTLLNVHGIAVDPASGTLNVIVFKV